MDLAEAGRQRLAVELVESGLGVEQVHLARTAGHEQENTALRLGRKMTRMRGQGVGRVPPLRVGLHQVIQAEKAEAVARKPQPVSSRNRTHRRRPWTSRLAFKGRHVRFL